MANEKPGGITHENKGESMSDFSNSIWDFIFFNYHLFLTSYGKQKQRGHFRWDLKGCKGGKEKDKIQKS